MKIQRVMAALVLVVVSGGVPNFSAPPKASPLEELGSKYYLNKIFWEKMQWANAEGSKLWCADGWEDPDSKLGEGKAVTKVQKLRFQSNNFTAKLFCEGDVSKKYSTVLYCDATQKQCDEFFQVFTKQFGTPLINDATGYLLKYSETNWVKMFMISYQWDVGPTRIDAMCFGTANTETESSEKPSFGWLATFAHTTTLKKLVPKFALRCTQRLQFDNEQQPRDLEDNVFWVSQYTNSILSSNNFIVGKDISITDDNISYTIVNGKVKIKYVINRITGYLRAETYSDDRKMGTITGKCEKCEDIKPKF